MGVKVGEAMDLTTGWDFREPEHRAKAREHRRKHKPKLLVGSPMCVMFCALQNLSERTEEKQRRWTEAREHMKFTMEMYLGKNGKMERARKRTSFMTNCTEIKEELGTKCDGGHEHQPLMSGRAAAPARYPEGVCKAVSRGLLKAMKNKGQHVNKLY